MDARTQRIFDTLMAACDQEQVDKITLTIPNDEESRAIIQDMLEKGYLKSEYDIQRVPWQEPHVTIGNKTFTGKDFE